MTVIINVSEANMRKAIIATLKQDERSMDGEDHCMYSGNGGLRCAIGHMVSTVEDCIALDDYEVGKSISYLLHEGKVSFTGGHISDESTLLTMSAMQFIHDGGDFILDDFNTLINRHSDSFPSGSITQAEIDAHA